MIHFFTPSGDQLVGYLDGGEVKNFRMDVVERDVLGLNALSFTMPASLPEAVGIEDRQRILIPHEKAGYQEFLCFNAIESRKEKKIMAVGSEIELNKLKYVPPNRHESFQLKYFIGLGVDGVEWKIGNVVNSGLRTVETDDYMGGFDFLKRMATEFDVELIFRVVIENGRITGRYVDAVEKIGTAKSGKEFVNAKDLVGVEREVHTDRFVTALLCILPDDVNGNPKPPILVTDPDAFQRWNRNGQHLIGIHKIDSTDEEMTDAKAEQYGRTELNKRIASVVDYRIKAVDLSPLLPHERAFLGDGVVILDEDFNPPLFAQARILNIKQPVKRPDEERPQVKEYLIGELAPISKASADARLEAMKKRFDEMVAEADRKAADAAAYAEGLLDSERFKQIMDSKVGPEALGDLATRDELNAQDEEQAARVAEAIRNIDLSKLATKAEADANKDEIKKEIVQSSRFNLIKNSTGFANEEYWAFPLNNKKIKSVMNGQISRLGFGFGFHFPAGGGAANMEQIVNVTPNKPLTLSWFLQKTAGGTFTIELLENAVVTLTVPDLASTTYDFISSYVNYVPTTSQLAVRMTASDTTDATITGLMLGEGNLPIPWATAQGELYNAYVRVYEGGLMISRLDENGSIEGQTRVTPEEFAIYFDENGNGDLERVFWFSRDETNTKKIKIQEELTLGTIKMVRVNTATNRGIAFVSYVPPAE